MSIEDYLVDQLETRGQGNADKLFDELRRLRNSGSVGFSVIDEMLRRLAVFARVNNINFQPLNTLNEQKAE